MSGKENLIRERAYKLWEQEGKPEDQAERHWERARQLIEDDDTIRADADAPADGAKPRAAARRSKTGTRAGKAGAPPEASKV